MNEISLTSIIKFTLNNLKYLITVAIIFAVLTFSYCQFIATPKYSASGSLLVTNGAITVNDENEIKKINSTDISASLGLAETITDVLKTNDIYKELSDTINNKYSYAYLKDNTTILRRNSSSLFIDVSFTANSSSEAVKILNSFLDLSPSYVSKLFPNSMVTITAVADAASKTYPKTIVLTVTAAIVSAIVALLICMFFNNYYNTISDETDFKSKYKIPVLGVIPDFSSAQKSNYYKSYYKGDVSHEK